jgi:hypothetical protein
MGKGRKTVSFAGVVKIKVEPSHKAWEYIAWAIPGSERNPTECHRNFDGTNRQLWGCW